MNREIRLLLFSLLLVCFACTCRKKSSPSPSPTPVVNTTDSSLVNLAHLNHLYVPVTFPDGTNAAGIYIYSNAPDYTLVEATGEGFTCIDDVARAVQVYIRDSKFSTDTSIQNKAVNLIRFIIAMQSPNGYFYNFLQSNGQINTAGQTSVNNANWWSWRALQALTEAASAINNINPTLATAANTAVVKLISAIKTNQSNLPQTTEVVNGITIPQWLPAGSGTDQAATLLLGLLPYCSSTNDTAMNLYVKKLADGIALMQVGDSSHFPYSCILSWQNTWHAYGADQAYALLKAGLFLHDSSYTSKALAQINNFYSWLLTSGMQSSFVVSATDSTIQLTSEATYDQIAYGIRPLVFAAVEAFVQTKDAKYADIAGHLAAWFLGNNAAAKPMYSAATGICYDGLSSGGNINTNSGAESTIEALLTMERVEMYPDVLAALNKYKK